MYSAVSIKLLQSICIFIFLFTHTRNRESGGDIKKMARIKMIRFLQLECQSTI